MAYYYEGVQGGHFSNDQVYYEQQSYGQMPMAYLESSTTSSSPAPVDPSLGPFSHSQCQTPWPAHQTHQIQQYMDGPRTAFFVPDHAQGLHSLSRPAKESNLLPPASQRRHGSPCSQQTLSSSDSHSPPTESDVLPATPPDYSATSPFLQQKQYTGDWEAQFQSHTLLGLDMRNACVNPHEVNDMFENEIVPTTFDSTATFSNFCCSESDDASVVQHSAFSSRQITPEPVIKQEASFVELPLEPNYPDPETGDTSIFEPEIKAEPLAIDDDKDLDYKPKHSRKRFRNTTTKSQARPSGSSHERKRSKINNNSGGLSSARLNATLSSIRTPKILCKECNTPFSDESTHQKHMKQHHTRPFVCVFNYAGCPSTFASKNEWKRHVSSQHLALQYWLCIQDGCCKTTNPPTNRRSSSSSSCSATPTPPALPNGAIFNRKDLYTQHVRRMHVPPDVRKAQKQKKSTPEWDDHLKILQIKAEKIRCNLPRYMRCPAINCGHDFTGPQAWDERMEHVARHLERAAEGKEPMVHFGGEHDPTLTQWASSADVYVVRRTRNMTVQWELINPLKGEVGPSAGNGKGGSSSSNNSVQKEIVVAVCSDEDAEGEDEE
ncbi:hypothetical protein CORC01_13501 [Colletotrichum orchidophilum]|uniref:C2H2-type domain-containing protein n=1 Tax=Colletotrichum orchidophilum TaxID=1209926 RepID=A0A1G4APU3_9PEZI|nr:uncharacterized protein CORC01_13501 [Colletotrichum orchidophilum]OHE91190.1 hypothetical protein CORC01_13501 [Colletotrichum orchidophilum]